MSWCWKWCVLCLFNGGDGDDEDMFDDGGVGGDEPALDWDEMDETDDFKVGLGELSSLLLLLLLLLVLLLLLLVFKPKLESNKPLRPASINWAGDEFAVLLSTSIDEDDELRLLSWWFDDKWIIFVCLFFCFISNDYSNF